ncbi:SRPBCC family protein [Streptomyces sp. NPDC101225]|uniref:SRPBCC family protein n=1 Tax=Streptomyces sp. NPDC101225 TaxID=3366135 RepID=UPI00380FCD9D
MNEIQSAITIARPVREVFDLLVDLENARYFDPQVRSVRRTTSGPVGVGTGFEFQEPLPPFGRVGRSTATYTEVVSGELIVMDIRIGRLRADSRFELAADGPGTRVTARTRMALPRPLRMLGPLLARQGTRVWDARLRCVKNWIEAGAPRDGSRPPAGTTGG